MKFLNSLNFKKKINKIFFVILFLIFFYPFSVKTFSGAVTINYFYIMLPIIIIFLKNTIKIPNSNIILIILIYCLIFITANFVNLELFVFIDRRIFSFIIFMSIFTYSLIDIKNDKVDAFKIALVLISIYFIISKLLNYYYYISDIKEIKVNLKYHLGSSRFGFIYIFGFWITLFYNVQSRVSKLLKIFIILLFLSGIYITYSRATVLSFAITLLIYLTEFIVLNFKKKRILSSVFTILFTLISLSSLQQIFFSNVDIFFSKYLWNFFSIEGLNDLLAHINNQNTSEGYRFYILFKIIEFVSINPFTGSGYLGCWIMFENLECSAHNQYSDVLFRTGLIGFLLYIFLLFKIFIYLWDNHKDLFYGLIATLIYGFFHETFKLSQGGFLLTFLFGMMMTHERNNNTEKLK